MAQVRPGITLPPLATVWAAGYTAVVGIDPGARYLGLAVVVPGGDTELRTVRSGKAYPDSAGWLAAWVEREAKICWGRCGLVAVEHMQVDTRTTRRGNARAHSVLRVQTVTGAVLGALWGRHDVLAPMPREWKGSQSKQATWAALEAHPEWGRIMAQAPNADVRDAVALAAWATQWVAAGRRAPEVRA